MLFQPLDHILATRAKLRLLRALATGARGSVRSLAREAGLSHTPALQALNELADAGIVSRDVIGRQHGFLLNPENTLVTQTLVPMFNLEAKRLHDIFAAVKSVAKPYGDKICGVYLFGSAARGEDKPGSDFDILVVTAKASALDAVKDEIVDGVERLRPKYGLRPSVIALTRKQLGDMRKGDHPLLRTVGNDVRVVSGPAFDDL